MISSDFKILIMIIKKCRVGSMLGFGYLPGIKSRARVVKIRVGSGFQVFRFSIPGSITKTDSFDNFSHFLGNFVT